MKIWKKIAGIMFTVCVAAAVLAVPNTQAHAKATVESKNIEITAQSTYTTSIIVKYAQGDAQIKNIKTSSGSLFAKQTLQDYHSYESASSSYPFGYAKIGLYAKKAGNYTVSFDVCDVNGKKTSSLKVKVKATKYNGNESPVKKVTFAGKQNLWFGLTNKKSGKFKVSMNSGYKLKSITVEYQNANGYQQKKIKNNAKVTLGTYVNKTEYENVYDYYEDAGNIYAHYYLDTSLFAVTTFRIEYQNKKTKAQGFTTYSLYRMPAN